MGLKSATQECIFCVLY